MPAGFFSEAGLEEEKACRPFLGSRSEAGLEVRRKKKPAGFFSEAGLEEENTAGFFSEASPEEERSRSGGRKSQHALSRKQVRRKKTACWLFSEAGPEEETARMFFSEASPEEEKSRMLFLGSRSGGRKSPQAFSRGQVGSRSGRRKSLSLTGV